MGNAEDAPYGLQGSTTRKPKSELPDELLQKRLKGLAVITETSMSQIRPSSSSSKHKSAGTRISASFVIPSDTKIAGAQSAEKSKSIKPIRLNHPLSAHLPLAAKQASAPNATASVHKMPKFPEPTPSLSSSQRKDDGKGNHTAETIVLPDLDEE